MPLAELQIFIISQGLFSGHVERYSDIKIVRNGWCMFTYILGRLIHN